MYQALYGSSKTYIRPLEMFLDEIDVNKAGNITGQKYRFDLAKDIDNDYTKN